MEVGVSTKGTKGHQERRGRNGVTADEVSAIGYRLDMSKYSVAPSITALTSSQWRSIKRENNSFYWSAIIEGVSII